MQHPELSLGARGEADWGGLLHGASLASAWEGGGGTFALQGYPGPWFWRAGQGSGLGVLVYGFLGFPDSVALWDSSWEKEAPRSSFWWESRAALRPPCSQVPGLPQRCSLRPLVPCGSRGASLLQSLVSSHGPALRGLSICPF